MVILEGNWLSEALFKMAGLQKKKGGSFLMCRGVRRHFFCHPMFLPDSAGGKS